ncbi:DUF6510 family protein [Deinococcus sp.]|uniref:DUF6510 family protein n=1 Tax=Deinococcus sp. TaxID=47478 RepID=UPI003B5B8FC5
MNDQHLDGNAVAGMLGAVLAAEPTTAHITCESCEQGGPVATLTTYLTPMGATLYCPSCGALLLRVAEVNGRVWLSLSGARSLQVSRP